MPISDVEILQIIERALAARRGYADGRSWPINRSLEEYGIEQDFMAAAQYESGAPFSDLRLRPRGEDPPDCEALDAAGRRIAVEVTELVDRGVVERVVEHGESPDAVWTVNKLKAMLAVRLNKKDIGDRLKGGPYNEYIVVIYTAEPQLDESTVRGWLSDHRFPTPRTIDRAYLSLDYEPGAGYPLIRLLWGGGAQRIVAPD